MTLVLLADWFFFFVAQGHGECDFEMIHDVLLITHYVGNIALSKSNE